MGAKRYILFGLAAISTVALNTYFFSQSIFASASESPKLATADQCVDEKAEAAPAENPNKVLFVSCGGFLE